LEIGHGYETKGATVSPKLDANGKSVWHWKAENVHDFMWAADPDYVHTQYKAKDGTQLHFLYQKGEKTKSWELLPAIMSEAFQYNAEHYGKYPYSDFYFIQGGDGGMEYPMSTLILGEGTLDGLVGVSVHESLHSWYQGVLGSNESLYPWIDEGFTTFAENHTKNFIYSKGLISGAKASDADPVNDDVSFFCTFSQSGKEELLTTHSDHYVTNRAYSIASYIKGAVFLQQIKYIVGEQQFDKGLLKYFDTWKFKHPNPNDVVRVFEKESGLELDWFKEYFVNSLNSIDYGVKKVDTLDAKTMKITLERKKKMPMPLDVVVSYDNGSQEMFYIPLDIMRGEKPAESAKMKFNLLKDWTWIYTTYEFEINTGGRKITKIEIDPSGRMADVNREDNVWPGK
jgi:hypothetical protein